MIEFVIAYYLVGLSGGFVAWYVLEYSVSYSVGDKAHPLTWGGLVGIGFTALLGPVCWAAAIIWGACWGIEVLNGKTKGVLSKPVFRQKRPLVTWRNDDGR